MPRRLSWLPLLFCIALLAAPAFATVFGDARGVVHDPEHRPIAGAIVTLHAAASDWSSTMSSDINGEFLFSGVPLGSYSVTVTAPNFRTETQALILFSGSEPILHFRLVPAGPNETVTVSGAPSPAPSGLTTTYTLIDRADIAETPGADRPNSLAMITDYVPGAYFTHDQLHVRGGHQTSWLIDGVPIPNTNIASNLGPQFNPGDIDYMEIDRGAYGADFGDRTYGVFNIVPRTGFERNNEGELVLSAGSFYQTNDQISFGSHTERMAYYASLNGNRSGYGIQTPVPETVHDAENGYGGYGSLLVNLNPSNQLRFITSLRRDFYQIPYDPNPNDIENNAVSGQFPSIGLRDAQHEADALVDVSWVHTFSPHWMLTASPFFHYNSADYQSKPGDFTFQTPSPAPVGDETADLRASTYAGGQLTFDATLPRNHLQFGLYSFYQHNSETYGTNFGNAVGSAPVTDHEFPTGSLVALFADDSFRPVPWLTLTAGLRPTFFHSNFMQNSMSASLSENAVGPRLGAAVTIPKINWTFRGFYGHYYQAPPLVTISGPLLEFATQNGDTFSALHGERDEEFQFGVTIPFRGWALDADTFRNRVNNFFDHSNIGESNLFIPITVQSALIRAWELTLRSPRFARKSTQLHLAYSNQIAEGGGIVTGGLTNSGAPIQLCDAGVPLCPLDHDQRNTLNVGGDVRLPWRARASTNVYYGSGFTNGQPGAPYPGSYLPAHTTFDLMLGKDFGKSYAVSVTALNVANRRVELDNSVTFGGFHWNAPREIYGELRYRFHY